MGRYFTILFVVLASALRAACPPGMEEGVQYVRSHSIHWEGTINGTYRISDESVTITFKCVGGGTVQYKRIRDTSYLETTMRWHYEGQAPGSFGTWSNQSTFATVPAGAIGLEVRFHRGSPNP